ncbi:hypothetical protein PTTG_00511 [Puccinia triticina 1-1 BBBD Race 1]|uniref:NTF2 domain-containing protein n=2 Tax=Puccinia triticina TaxID=208348 RepID=A0A0C4EIE4_PUCT1|nr:uncharacterized protein PtA15_2A515 [Puccinia triticina]OAV99703.1 hypothetical protein PTTG_00511 [Puccinia triticina 1-1 BBBD Race 1]WAQ82198.1 hypothetical protein PtA15_2A515 [Puccinia triticina]WAR53055.1 hypothetical protein PtB15_2B484 [Puccinia triticina]
MAAPASSIVKSAQNASEIGWAFVPQYYTFVNKDPSRLHCFYTKRSTLIHSTEGEEATPCFGQQEIHEKFMSLEFDDCKVFVSNVDSQSSADGGIIVQVLGEMSNQAGPWRKFAQTFFLAEQPNGFFVLNDIFRYMKEEDDDAEDEPEAEPVTVTEDIARSETSMNAVGGADPAHSSTNTAAVDPSSKPVDSSAAAPPPPAQSSVRAPEQKVVSEPAPSQPAAPSQVNGFHPEPREAKPPEPSTESTKAAPKPAQTDAPAAAAAPSTDAAVNTPAPAATASVASSVATPAEPPKAKTEAPAPAGPSTSTASNNANGRPAAPQPKPAATPAVAPPKQAEPPQPAAPKTWASLAASGKSAWGQGHLSASQGVSSAPSAAAQAATEPTPAQSQNRQPAGGPQHSNPDRHPPVASITTGSCFIKSVNENIDEKTLREQLLKRFGPIKELDIVRNKACGFLEFERIDSAKKAIQMSMPFNMGGKGGIPIVLPSGEEYVINVESKRQPGERGRPVDAGPKRGFSERGGRPGSSNFGPTGNRGGRGGMDGGARGSGRGGSNTPRGGGAGRNLTNSK